MASGIIFDTILTIALSEYFCTVHNLQTTSHRHSITQNVQQQAFIALVQESKGRQLI